MKNCPSLNRGFQEKCNNCGVVGHKAAQCPKRIHEIADKEEEQGKEPEQEVAAIPWGGINGIAAAYKAVPPPPPPYGAQGTGWYTKGARGRIIGGVHAVTQGEEKKEEDMEQAWRYSLKDLTLEEWNIKLEEEYEKDRKGHRNVYYIMWLVFAASAFIKGWSIEWDIEKCREELIKEGHIKVGEEERGRNHEKKRTSSTCGENQRSLGDIMPVGMREDRHWFRETATGYEID